MQAGVAILAAQAHADRGRVALLEERERIAREMHDNVIQQLFATGLSLQSAVPLAQHPVVRTRLSKAVDDARPGHPEIRQAIFELHTEDPGESLLGNLRAIAESYAVSLGFVPEVRFAGARAAVRAASRGRHRRRPRGTGQRGAARPRPLCDGPRRQQRQRGRRRSTSLDDGVGFDPAEARSGLVNLRNRATAQGGTLEIRPSRSGGTALHWHIPKIDSRE